MSWDFFLGTILLVATSPFLCFLNVLRWYEIDENLIQASEHGVLLNSSMGFLGADQRLLQLL